MLAFHRLGSILPKDRLSELSRPSFDIVTASVHFGYPGYLTSMLVLEDSPQQFTCPSRDILVLNTIVDLSAIYLRPWERLKWSFIKGKYGRSSKGTRRLKLSCTSLV
jgi:hypothetical protein